MSSVVRHVLVSTCLALSLAAQNPREDVIGVTFTGEAFTVDSYTGGSHTLGSTGRTGHNCMARSGRLLYSVEQVGSGTTAQRFLNTIDDVTGQAFRSVAINRDLRGLESGGQSQLMAIADNGLDDQLVRVSVLNGSITVVGSTGFGAVQALALHAGTFYGWDLNAGLIRIDFLTGAAVDVNPGLGTNGADIQFLTTMADGRVIGGRSALYSIDLATGVPTLLGSGGYSDLRGAEERFGVTYTFGQSCHDVTLSVSGTPSPGSTVTITSSRNRAGAAGVMLLGFSDREYLSLALPVRVDPFVGSLDCFLHTSVEVSFALTANGLGLMSVPLTAPQFTNGLAYHVQHVSLANVRGGLAFSEGGTVRLRL